MLPFTISMFSTHPDRKINFLECFLEASFSLSFVRVTFSCDHDSWSGGLFICLYTITTRFALYRYLAFPVWSERHRCGVSDTGVSFPPHLPCPDSQ